MEISTTIKKRMGHSDAPVRGAYQLSISVADCGDFPHSGIFNQEGGVVESFATEAARSTTTVFRGSYSDCQRVKEALLLEIQHLLKDWEALFPFPEEEETFQWDGSQLQKQ